MVLLATFVVFFFYKGDIPVDVVDARYSSPGSQFLKLANGTRVHFRDEGIQRGVPVVLVHGSNASLHTFEPWVKILGKQFRVVTLDVPGHGLTGAVPDGDYSSSAALATVRAVTRHLELESYYLGGNSMGGGISWRYALNYPDEIRGLLLINASGLRAWRDNDTAAATEVSAESETPDPPLAFRLLGQPWFRAIALRFDPYYLVKQGLQSAYNHSPVVDEDLIRRYYDLSLREGTRAATLARFGNISSREDGDLSLLTMPTLVMWGRMDSVISVDVAHRFKAAMPQSELVIFDKAGHIPMEEIPEASAAAVADFIVRNELGRAAADNPLDQNTQ